MDYSNVYEFKSVNSDGLETTVKFKAITLDNVLENFELFLRGCGYHVNGVLDIVQDHYPEFEKEYGQVSRYVNEEDEEDLNMDYAKEVSNWFKSFGEPPKDNISIGEFK